MAIFAYTFYSWCSSQVIIIGEIKTKKKLTIGVYNTAVQLSIREEIKRSNFTSNYIDAVADAFD